jgi:site-specific DNA recombinase
MRCAVCGGGIVHFNKIYIGCASARNKGTCDNKGTMRRDHLETAVLDGLQNRLMEPGRIKIFCEEYARAMNRLHAEHNAQRAADVEALNKAERDLARLVQALLDGVPASAVREKMTELEARRDALGHRLASSEDSGIRLHPNMAEYYRTQVADLRAVLAEDGRQREAADIVRKLVDRIELSPVVRGGRKSLSVSLYGRLAGILAMAQKQKRRSMRATLRSWSPNWLRGLDLDFVTYSTRRGWKPGSQRHKGTMPGNVMVSSPLRVSAQCCAAPLPLARPG